MGMHTWFHKERKLYDEESQLYEKLYQHEEGEIWLDDLEIMQIQARVQEISNMNDCDEFHDLFRTNKRDSDGCYSTDVIYSKKECDKWLEENKTNVDYPKELTAFWEKYPNGVIRFG